ncbi:MAG: protein kinase domain-containing protein [Armatimonadota bacterium]
MSRPTAGHRPLRRGDRFATHRGQTLEVVAWVGEGSYARVYQARLGGAACALKLAKTEIPGAERRLAEEEAVLRRADHPRVVRLLDSGSSDAAPFLALEWLEGRTLSDAVPARGLPLRQVLETLEAVADGLAHLHARGLLHGDLRPQNVMLTADRGAVLTDPGGTEPPPGAPPSSEAEDMRAAGRVLYFMLTGREGAVDPTRLAPFNRGVVAVWERTQAETPLSAADLRAEAAALHRSL